MAHFYGTLDGSRGSASRLGTKNSGLTVQAMAWGGCIRVSLHHNDSTGQDMARVELRGHPSQGGELRRVLYDGPVAGKVDLRSQPIIQRKPSTRERVRLLTDPAYTPSDRESR